MGKAVADAGVARVRTVAFLGVVGVPRALAEYVPFVLAAYGRAGETAAGATIESFTIIVAPVTELARPVHAFGTAGSHASGRA